MGSGRWNAGDWKAYSSAHVVGKSTAQVFASTQLNPDNDPLGIVVRESRNSPDNPKSTPIILAADVTGSMGHIADALMRDGLDTLIREIHAKRPVTDPHVMVMAVGDAAFDRAPLQATQFEADIRLADQVKDLWLERGGGANRGESYLLPHVFAGMKVEADAWADGRKGYLFTIGDEPFLDGVTREQAAKFLGIQLDRDLDARECVDLVKDKFEVFHVIVEERSKGRHDYAKLIADWSGLLPQRVIRLGDHAKLAETVVSAIQIAEGASKASVVAGWSDGTDLVVADAVRDLAARSSASGAVRL